MPARHGRHGRPGRFRRRPRNPGSALFAGPPNEPRKAPMADVSLAPDLTRCDREPIHVPGAIQPHGVLLVVDPATLRVVQVAGDTAAMLGRAPAAILETALDTVLAGEAAALIPDPARSDWPEPIYLGSFAATGSAQRLDLTAHARDGMLVFEIEPAPAQPEIAAQTLAKVRRVSAAFERAGDLPGVLDAAVRAFRSLTGFDRVMIYRFLDDGSGAVVAEDKAETLAPLLNHHYPASDIPKQARALYLQNLIRVIPDATYVPAPLTPPVNPVTRRPLDMSECALRSVSPVHLQYLKNMGVTASMSVSIVVDGALWGLVSCHHGAPKLVPYELRETLKHLGHILGEQVRAREETLTHRQALNLATTRDAFLASLAGAAPLEERLLERVEAIRDLVPADGAAIIHGEAIRVTGHAPDAAQIADLARWLVASRRAEPYATNSLPRDYAPAKDYAAHGSGVLACFVDRDTPLAVLWFRAEQMETIEWAGNPHKPVEAGAEAGPLTPRRSFEVWKETVRHQARPWAPAEIDAARRLADAVRDLRQQITLRELNLQLRRTLSDKEVLLTQKDLLMQEVNHRVQNSLQLVNSMLHLQARQLPDPGVKAHFEEASRRIMAVSTVHQRLWRRSDHIQNVDFGAYLEELRDGLLESWGAGWRGQIKVHAPPVLVPTNQAVILALVITELLTNAVKYAYEGQPGPIELKVNAKGRSSLQVSVTDQGVGMGDRQPKNGLGSRLVHSLVSQIGGEIDVTAAAPGTAIVLTVPLAASA